MAFREGFRESARRRRPVSKGSVRMQIAGSVIGIRVIPHVLADSGRTYALDGVGPPTARAAERIAIFSNHRINRAR